jgi:hypothetical protein
MKITRNVIQDLLPLYLANEVSDDTKALVDAYLESDPELAARIKEFEVEQIPAEIPVSLIQEKEMEAYQKAKIWLAIRTIILAIFIATICIIPILIFFLVPE